MNKEKNYVQIHKFDFSNIVKLHFVKLRKSNQLENIFIISYNEFLLFVK